MSVDTLLENFLRRYLYKIYPEILNVYKKYLDINTFRLRHLILKHLQTVVDSEEPPVFVQVGSNDGLANDPFYSWVTTSNCVAVLVEPVVSCFERLKLNYLKRLPASESFRIHFVNAAVSDIEGSRTFYVVADEAVEVLGKRLPFWWDQLGSFEEGHIEKHLDGDLKAFVREIEVPTVSLNNLARGLDLNRIDVLHIDAEGHDLKVLKSLDFDKFRPNLILMEWKHLSRSDMKDTFEILQKQGYNIRKFKSDLLATINNS
jgi:FkbM family methyltransferase